MSADLYSDPYADVPHTADLADVDDHFEQRWTHDRAVAEEVRRLRVRRDAARTLRLEERAQQPAEPFDLGTLADVLARPPEPAMRVEGLVPSSASVELVAQRKTGKTTWALNYAEALLTGADFLGRFPVVPLTGNVALLNYEVSGAQLARWARDVGIDGDRLVLANLRGRRNPLSDPEDRAALAARLREHDVEALIVDPFGRAYGGTSQNDAGEVGAWLVGLDHFARAEVGATDLVLTAHAGWNGERTRGSSALEDWADVIVTLTRDAEAEDSPTYMRAVGRDVDLDEDALTFDPDTRHLSMTGTGSRRAAKRTRKLEDVMGAMVQAAQGQPPLSVNALGRLLREQGVPMQKGDENQAAAQLVERGIFVVSDGPRGAKLHALRVTTPDHPQPPPAGQVTTTPDRPLRVGGGGGVPQTLDYPHAEDDVA